MGNRIGRTTSLLALAGALTTVLAGATANAGSGAPAPAGSTSHVWVHRQTDPRGETTARYDLTRVVWRIGPRVSATLHLRAMPTEWYSHVDLEIGDEPVFLVMWAKGHADGTIRSKLTMVSRDATIPTISCPVRVRADPAATTIRISVSNDCLRKDKHHRRYADWFRHGGRTMVAVGRTGPERFDRTGKITVPHP